MSTDFLKQKERFESVCYKKVNDGREINAQPLGKVKINRKKDVQGGTVLVTEIRQSDRSKQPKDPLAKAAE